MKKKKIGIIILMLFVILGIILLCIYKQNTTDAIKFKREYESLNGTIREKDGKTIRTLSIDKDNPFVYKKAEEIVDKMDNKETFVVYFGFSDCPWCRSVLPTLIKAAKDFELDSIYYVDIKEIRDELSIDKNGKVVTEKKGSKGYYELLKRFDNILEDYTLTDEQNKEINTKEKRIYAPNIIGVVKGKAEKLTTGISEKQTDGYMKLTDEMKEDTYNQFKCVLKCVTEKDKTCSIDKGC